MPQPGPERQRPPKHPDPKDPPVQTDRPGRPDPPHPPDHMPGQQYGG